VNFSTFIFLIFWAVLFLTDISLFLQLFYSQELISLIEKEGTFDLAKLVELLNNLLNPSKLDFSKHFFYVLTIFYFPLSLTLHLAILLEFLEKIYNLYKSKKEN